MYYIYSLQKSHGGQAHLSHQRTNPSYYFLSDKWIKMLIRNCQKFSPYLSMLAENDQCQMFLVHK